MTLANTLTWDGHHKVGAEGIANSWSRVIIVYNLTKLWYSAFIWVRDHHLGPVLHFSKVGRLKLKPRPGEGSEWCGWHTMIQIYLLSQVSMDITSNKSQSHSAKGTFKTWYVSFWILAVTLDLESSQRECITTFEVNPNSKSPNQNILYNVCPVPLSWFSWSNFMH